MPATDEAKPAVEEPAAEEEAAPPTPAPAPEEEEKVSPFGVLQACVLSCLCQSIVKGRSGLKGAVAGQNNTSLWCFAGDDSG